MDSVIAVVLWGHIAVAFAGIGTFWVPVSTRKGGRLHRGFGKIFAGCAYLVNGSALALTAIRLLQMVTGRVSITADPESGGLTVFLGYLAIVTLTWIRQAIRVIETRDDPAALRTPFHMALAWGSMLGSFIIGAVAVLFWSRLSILFLLLSPVGLLLGAHILRYARSSSSHPRAWMFEHMTAMLGAGVAFHTAFAVFGLGRLFGLAPKGAWWFLPWIVPAAVGVPIVIAWNVASRRRYATETRIGQE
jgi:hypothetical protein